LSSALTTKMLVLMGFSLVAAGLYLTMRPHALVPVSQPPSNAELQLVLKAPCAAKAREKSRGRVDRLTVWFAQMSCEPEFRQRVLELAEGGDPQAQFIAYVSYTNGYGVEKDKDLGFRWLLEVAKNGDPVARHNLRAGCGPDTGPGVFSAEQCGQVPDELLAR